MAYRDDLYAADNLIGYTGQIHKMPTVYFRKGNLFGHITQYHDLPQNNGREEVGNSAEYKIANEPQKDGTSRCVERIGTKAFHTSRNLFIPADKVNSEDKAVLLQAIWKFPEKKDISEMRDHIEEMLDQSDRKKAMHAELLKKR